MGGNFGRREKPPFRGVLPYRQRGGGDERKAGVFTILWVYPIGSHDCSGHSRPGWGSLPESPGQQCAPGR